MMQRKKRSSGRMSGDISRIIWRRSIRGWRRPDGLSLVRPRRWSDGQVWVNGNGEELGVTAYFVVIGLLVTMESVAVGKYHSVFKYP